MSTTTVDASIPIGPPMLLAKLAQNPVLSACVIMRHKRSVLAAGTLFFTVLHHHRSQSHGLRRGPAALLYEPRPANQQKTRDRIRSVARLRPYPAHAKKDEEVFSRNNRPAGCVVAR